MIQTIHTSKMSSRYRICALILALSMIFSPAMAVAAAPAIPGFYGRFTGYTASTNLPVRPTGSTLPDGLSGIDTVGNLMTITQNKGQSNVVIDWSSFNIAPGNTVRFYQGSGTPGTKEWKPNRDYAALNRIYDSNPSQIFGNLTADGKIYLINRNGILFGRDSQVNVHSLAASALNITQDNFNKGLLRFTTTLEPAQTGALGNDVTIANHGTITTDSGGSVSLIGPRVENAGYIYAPQGSVNLVGIRESNLATDDLNLLTSFDIGSPSVLFNAQATPGIVVNFSNGFISSDSGRIGLYGDTVQQGGIIRSVSAVKRAGEIFLKAKSRVTTDAGSVTETPVSTSAEKVNQTFVYNGGAIQAGGLTTATTFVTGPDGNIVKTEGALQAIEHNGSMSAPGGQVMLSATERIFMGTGSSINVAGVWVDLPSSASMVSSTLNSVELRDFYVQKYGALKGEKIWTDLLNGSSIGDISGSYGVEEKSAMERSTRGGAITLTAGGNGQIIVKDGATLDISGGGSRYGQGVGQASMLVAGKRVFDIGSAPQSFNYRLLDTQSKTYSRSGVTDTFNGQYYGGASSVYSRAMDRIAGSDAGTLSLAAGVLKLDGSILGTVTRGIFQTKSTAHSSLDASDSLNKNYFANVARGLEVPVGGSVLIGADPGATPGGQNLYSDSLVQEIVVRPTTVPLAAAFGAYDTLSSTRTELSAALLSGGGLGNLSLFSNTTLKIESGVHLALSSGGSFTAKARRIEHGGEIVVPGGSASFVLQDNITAVPEIDTLVNPRLVPLVSDLYFAPGSLVSVAGETIDNSRVGRSETGVVRNGILKGGNIFIKDLTVSNQVSGNNLVVAEGATLDVSGGYLIDPSGKVNGGDAGSLDLRAMNLSLVGDLRGLALLGKKGGEITLHTGEIVVGLLGSNQLPDDLMKGKLLLSQDRFMDTGFTRLNLISVNDITFSSGIDLKPSTARLAAPVTGGASISPNDVFTSPDFLGQTSIKATAGTPVYSNTLLDGITPIVANQNAKIRVEQGALLRTAGNGTIVLTASGVDVAGTLSSPGGTISVTTRGTGDVTDLNLMEGARILAGGYNKPDGKTLPGTLASFVPQSAGSVSLVSDGGSVTMNAGSLVDLSGSDPTTVQLRDTGGSPQQVVVAGDPGKLSLTYRNKLTLGGTITGKARLAGVIGGTLEISKNPDSNNTALELLASDVALYQGSGFDALAFKSSTSVKLPNLGAITVGRSLTLDTPIITGNPNSQTTLFTPWLILKNSSAIENLNPGQTLDRSGSRLTIAAKSLDISGNLQINGFQDVRLESARDITFSDRINSNNNGWIGNLWTTGNLTLQAQRIYPTTASNYTITSNGRVTTLPHDSGPVNPGSIYSAGGSLSILAQGGIDHRGLLAAPMGTILLDGQEERVYLAQGSSIITGGSVPVSYGYFDGTTWSVKGINNQGGTSVQATPDKSVILKGREVIVGQGAAVDSSGGGSINAALWQAGLEGSVDPFSLSTRYVILPDNSVTLPGKAIYLDAVPELGLKAGVYSVLPANFAFVPGALVIQSTGTKLVSGSRGRTAQGYTVAAGYETVTDTAVSSPLSVGYVVRRATDVENEGNFTKRQFVAGDGGTITVSASETAVIGGSLNGTPLTSGQGAVFSLSGANVQVKKAVAALNSGFDFDTPLPSDLVGTMQLQADTVSNKGLKELKLGDSRTDTVVVQEGSVLQVSEITMTANKSVTVMSGLSATDMTKVLGMGEGGAGTVTVNAPAGTFTVENMAEVRASHGLTLNVANVVLNGEFKADNSSLNLTAQNIFFVPDTFQRGTAGLYLNEALWKTFSQYEDLTLKSSNDLTFQRGIDLVASGSLTIDAGRLLNQAGQGDVSIQAKKLSILNSGATQSATESLKGKLTLSADTITVSAIYGAGSKQGGVLFDGFSTVNMTSAGDLLLQGAGSIATKGDLKLTASRLAATYLPSATGAFLSAADFRVTSGGAFNYVSSSKKSGPSGLSGGNLAVEGSSVRIAGLIDMPSGNLSLSAVGGGATDGVFLDSGASIKAQGAVVQTADTRTSISTPGGRVTLSAKTGPVAIAEGALVDVSAVSGSDAGSVVLSAPVGGVSVAAGVLQGKKSDTSTSLGGSFAVDSATLANEGDGGLDGLSKILSDSGFTNRIAIRSRDDEALSLTKTLTGREVVVAADGGDIVLSGTGSINANGVNTGEKGGRVELYAKDNLTVSGGITATGVGADGGEVHLGSEAGMVSLQKDGGLINVDGGNGGSVTLRALRNSTTGVNMNLTGEIRGASQVVAEAFKVYDTNTLTTSVETKIGTKPATSVSSETVTAITSLNPITSITKVTSIDPVTKEATITTTTVKSGSVLDSVMADSSKYMESADSFRSTLLVTLTKPTGWDTKSSQFHFLPGVEIRGANLDLSPGIKTTTIDNGITKTESKILTATPWDLTNKRYGTSKEPGIITLRASGNLNINENLVDHPTALTSLHSDTMQSSWGMNLVAGADLGGASPLSVTKGVGNLVLGPMKGGRLSVDANDNALGGALVYTENGSINFASGNNTDIGYGVLPGFGLLSTPGYMINSTMRYNFGSYGGSVRGDTGGDLVIRAGAIQTAVGDIDLRVGSDLELLNRKDGSFGTSVSKYPSSTGSIRTTGEYEKYIPGTNTLATTKSGPDFPSFRTTKISDYWTYAGGGSIGLDVIGSVAGQVNTIVNAQDTVSGNSNAWDTAIGGTAGTNKYLTANYSSTDTTEGIATLAGGNISVRSGKEFTSQVGTFGSGDLTIASGGDINGRYRNTSGSGKILAMGNFGADPQVLELGASQTQVVAMGNLNIGAILNPDNTRSGVSLGDSVWDLTYTFKNPLVSGSRDTSISLISLAGIANLSGKSDFDGYKTSGQFLTRQSILPPLTEIVSSGDLQINGQFALAPSPSGDLRLISGGNITNSANSSLAMVDVSMDTSSPTYAYQRIAAQNDSDGALASLFKRTGINLLHQGDTRVAQISSGLDKDIVNLQLNIDKPVSVQAGRDITELVFSGQNLDSQDVTSIRAGRDIVYSFSVNQPSTALEAIGPGIKQGGPGALLVQAGRNIDLGNSTGIQSVGSFLNPPLGDDGSSVTVIAGAKLNDLKPTDVAAFFYGVDGRTDHADLAQNGLIKAGDIYSQLKSGGDTVAADAQLAATRNALVRPLFNESDGDGYITMTASQINSLGNKSDVNILSRSSLDVGKSSIGGSSGQQGSGISTAGGGRINVYSGQDVNVNESRVMSYLGGDISIWVDKGDLNAGRGSRTSISPSPPRKVYDPTTKTFITKFTPPAVGSGIRAVTFDPNTSPGGPLPIPEAGNINIYVPNGKIDAGEAGIITANKLTLAATQVLNVKNIVGGAGSVGVPLSSDSSVSLNALGGNSNLTDNSKMIESASAGGLSKTSAQTKLAQVTDDFLSKYLDVRVISFETDDNASEKDKKEKKK